MATIMELFAEWERLLKAQIQAGEDECDGDWAELANRRLGVADQLWALTPKMAGELAAIMWAMRSGCSLSIAEEYETKLLRPLIDAERKPSEIMAIFRQWYDLVMLINADDFLGRPDAEAHVDQLHDQRYALLDRVSALEPATAEETMAQVMMTCEFGEEWLANSSWGESVRDRFAARLGIGFPSYVQA